MSFETNDRNRTGRQKKKGGYQPKYARAPRKKFPVWIPVLLIAVCLLGLAGVGLYAYLQPDQPGTPPSIPEIQMTEQPAVAEPVQTEPTVPPTTLPPLPQVVSTARITVTGDLLPHKKVYNQESIIYKGPQDYNFDPIFKFLGGYTDTADYAIANLETALYGPNRPYTGNPKFNTPDQLVDGVKNAGFDMLLTANNHCNDMDLDGILRTVQVIRDKGLVALGTNLTEEEPKYQIVDLNGIKIGMLCYTYEDSQNPYQVTLNYNALPSKGKNLVCTFPKFGKSKSREPFYEALTSQIAEMKEQGADAIVLFVHWGEEYHLEASKDQREMAQKFCDMGIDLVVGGHPHVVEPIELITSTEDPNRKMVCLYSLGNAFSNQMRDQMKSQKSGHTEDGMLFNITFQKYDDDSVYLAGVDVIPTWVEKHNRNEEKKREYNILPLDNKTRDQWQELYAIDETLFGEAEASYDRTMAIVGEGLKESNAWLSRQLPDAQAIETENP